MIVVVGCVVLAVTIVPGVWLWWPLRHDGEQRGALGAALLTGAVVSFAVFAVQLVFDARLRDIDERRADEQARRAAVQQEQADRAALQLTVGLQEKLAGIDLNGRDLSGFFLSGKKLQRANLTNANLRGANLSRTNLTQGQLQGAHLEDAHLDGANLTGAVLALANLSRAVLTQATLADAELSSAVLSGADLTGVDLSGASIAGATYDSKTKWPRSAGQKPCPPGETCLATPLS